jgi:hypothetical protein
MKAPRVEAQRELRAPSSLAFGRNIGPPSYADSSNPAPQPRRRLSSGGSVIPLILSSR